MNYNNEHSITTIKIIPELERLLVGATVTDILTVDVEDVIGKGGRISFLSIT